MTDQEAIAKAQKELDMDNYFAETALHAGLRTVHSNRAEWLCRVLRLARKALNIEENHKQPKTNADRIRAMSDEQLAKLFMDFAVKCYDDCGVSAEIITTDYVMELLKQPAEER